MEHKFTESYKVNFEKLERRILNAKYEERSKELISSISGKIIIVCTGGSKIVGNYLQLCLEGKGNIVKVIEPRDYFYMNNVYSYDNLVTISNSMRSNGLDFILENFKGEKYVITGSGLEFESNNIRYKIEDREKSFISLATTLVPMKLILESIVGSIDISWIILSAIDRVNDIDYNFSETNLIQVLSGYDSFASASALESCLIETGALSVVIHDKGSFCHGRSNLLFRNPSSPIVLLESAISEFNRVINESISNYKVLDFSDVIYNNILLEEFYKVVCMYYLSLKICLDKGIDITCPDYDTGVVRKLYNYRGVM